MARDPGYTATGPTLRGFETGSGDTFEGTITYGVNVAGDFCGVHGESNFLGATRTPSSFVGEADTVGVSGSGGTIGVVGEGFEIAGVVGVTLGAELLNPSASIRAGVLGVGHTNAGDPTGPRAESAPGVIGLCNSETPEATPKFPRGAGVYGASSSPMGAGVVGISMTKFSGGVKLGAGDMLPTPAVLWNDPRDGNVVTGPDGKGNGVAGWSNTGAGVFGVSEQKFGVVGRCRIGNGFGVVGIQGEPARKNPFVVTGDVTGDNAHPAGVHGHNYGTGSGVSGFSVSGYGGVFQSNTVAQLRLVQLDLALLNPLGPPSPSGDPNGVVIGQPGDLLVTLAPARQALPPQAVLWFCKRVETSHPKGVWVQIA